MENNDFILGLDETVKAIKIRSSITKNDFNEIVGRMTELTNNLKLIEKAAQALSLKASGGEKTPQNVKTLAVNIQECMSLIESMQDALDKTKKNFEVQKVSLDSASSFLIRNL